MKSTFDKVFRRLARALGATTVSDIRQLREAMRIVTTFGITILLPAVLLSYFALNSIQSQELTFDADINRRSEAITLRIDETKQNLFFDFQEAVHSRIERGLSAVTRLGELSPYLLVAYELDLQGNLVGPFKQPEYRSDIAPSATYRRQYARGVTAEQQAIQAQQDKKDVTSVEFYRQAERHFLNASAATDSPGLKGQADFAAARTSWRAGHVHPEDAFGRIIAKYGSIRDTRGFRLDDLARITQAEMGLLRDQDAGVYAIHDLVNQILAERWTIGEAGEAQILGRALSKLEKEMADGANIDPGWLSRARTTRNERKRHLFWSGALWADLASVLTRLPSQADQFQYKPPEQGGNALWVALKQEEAVYVYAFDQAAIMQSLKASIEELASVDADIDASIRSVQPLSAQNETVLNLGPHLPFSEVTVAAANPQALTRRKSRLRTTQVVIIVLAISMTIIGILLSARTITREMEAARTKADFAANVSHELRSPITQIRLKGEALQLDLIIDEADQRAHYDAIVRESERLSRLVDNVLDFSAIERGAKKYTFRPEDMQIILDTAASSTLGAFIANGGTVNMEVADNLPVVWGDREALSQVMVNLLSNAVKYGGSSQFVGIRALVEQDTMVITVSDKGLGISKEDVPQVFDNFFRSSNPEVRRKKGTGIGLSIVRYIVEAHGGTIEVDSSLGAGTTFTIYLPLQRAPHEPGEKT